MENLDVRLKNEVKIGNTTASIALFYFNEENKLKVAIYHIGGTIHYQQIAVVFLLYQVEVETMMDGFIMKVGLHHFGLQLNMELLNMNIQFIQEVYNLMIQKLDAITMEITMELQ